MKTVDQSIELAKLMVSIGTHHGYASRYDRHGHTLLLATSQQP